MKHTGINLRLTKNGYSTVHSSVGGFKNAVKNTFLKPVWRLLTWHGLQLHDSRMDEYYKDLNKVTIDDLYKDQTVVSKEFAEGKAKSNHNEDWLIPSISVRELSFDILWFTDAVAGQPTAVGATTETPIIRRRGERPTTIAKRREQHIK